MRLKLQKRIADGGIVSTVEIPEWLGKKPFETIVAHPEYHNELSTLADATVVQAYDTEEEAAAGHCYWLKLYEEDQLPMELVDCGNAICPPGLKVCTLPVTVKKS